jgi:hypothetical protein
MGKDKEENNDNNEDYNADKDEDKIIRYTDIDKDRDN